MSGRADNPRDLWPAGHQPVAKLHAATSAQRLPLGSPRSTALFQRASVPPGSLAYAQPARITPELRHVLCVDPNGAILATLEGVFQHQLSHLLWPWRDCGASFDGLGLSREHGAAPRGDSRPPHPARPPGSEERQTKGSRGSPLVWPWPETPCWDAYPWLILCSFCLFFNLFDQWRDNSRKRSHL